MNRERQPLSIWLLCTALGAITLATYWPAIHHDFVNYDDPDYILLNETIQKGLSLEGIKWAFTSGYASNWHPLTWISHMCDISLFGIKPMGHHLTNLLFHSINTILLLLLLRIMTGATWRSAIVAGLFALHPLHVESVAWVAERKDLLSAFFGILTLLAYARYVGEAKVQSPKSKVWYGVALGLFALGLMSKPMLVTWPFVMLLLDFWPLGRTHKNEDGRWKMEDGRILKRLIREKIPFLALVAISCMITLKVQQGAMSSVVNLPLSDRLGNAVLAYADYLSQTVWPTDLAIFYPHIAPPPTERVIFSLALLLILTCLSLIKFKQSPSSFVGWCWYLGTLIPVIGIVQVGGQARADRYTYLPLIGIFILVTWGGAAILAQRGKLRHVIPGAAILILVTMALLTRGQLRHWKNSETLFTHAIKVTQGNYIAWAGLGIIEYRRNNYDLAIQHLARAQEAAPPGVVGRQIEYYIGATLQKQGKGMEALPYFELATEVGTLQAERDYRLGLSLIEAGRLEEAEAALTSACEAKPNSPDFLLGKAALLHKRGKLSEAEAVFETVLARHPNNGLGHHLYANFLTLANQPDRAEAEYGKALTLQPNEVNWRVGRAQNLVRLGRRPEAIHEYLTALKQQPNNAELCANLGELYVLAGQTKQGIDAYETAVRLSPDSLNALNNLAWILATQPAAEFRNGPRAVELAEQACKLTEEKVPVLLGTLAAAYAEAGRFEEAIATADKARILASEQNQGEVAQRNMELLKLYRAGKPARD